MKALHLTHNFFLYICYKKILPLLSTYYFHRSMHHFCLYGRFSFFYESWLNQFINLTRASITFFVECYYTCTLETKTFLQSEMRRLYGKKCATKVRFRFYECGIYVRLENLFSYKQVLTFQ